MLDSIACSDIAQSRSNARVIHSININIIILDSTDLSVVVVICFVLVYSVTAKFSLNQTLSWLMLVVQN